MTGALPFALRTFLLKFQRPDSVAIRDPLNHYTKYLKINAIEAVVWEFVGRGTSFYRLIARTPPAGRSP